VPQEALPSQTSNALRFTATTDLNGTKYYVKVSNQSATGSYSTYSNVATLKVASRNALLSIGSVTLNYLNAGGIAPLSLQGVNTLRAIATGVDPGALKLSYQWRRNGQNIASGMVAASGTVSPGTSNFALEYRLPADLDSNSDGVYDVLVDNGAVVAASPAITVTMDPKILAVEVPNSVNPSDPVRMTASFTGKASSYRYEWYNGTGKVRSGTASGASPFTAEHNLSSVENVGTLAAGSYKVRVFDAAGTYVESKPVVMSVATPASIITQPVPPLRVGAKGSFTLSVGASGDRLNYQWSRDGAAISAAEGGTSSVLLRTGTGNLEGAYQVKVWNEFSMALSDVAGVSVSNDLGVDVIQPGTADIGGSANLIANASGPGELSYQWYKGASAIPGATGESHKISPVTAADGAQYWVKVTSSENTPNSSVNSGSVSLGVRDVPRILVAPVSRVVGGSETSTTTVSFTVVAESRVTGGTLTYTWDNVVSGTVTSRGNTSTLTVTVPSGGNSSKGTYSVTVASGGHVGGEVKSGSITLTANLTVLGSSEQKNAATTAGSDGVSLHTGWWVYWVTAIKKSDGSSRSGYYALERQYKGGVVSPRRAVWVWQPANVSTGSSLYPKDVWHPEDQSVLDAVASERGEFSVFASRIASGSAASGDYAIAGRLEEQGEGSLYGAPDLVEGVYSDATDEYTVELSWDMEQVYRMDAYGDADAALEGVIGELQKVLRDVLLNSD
jgi:hypothetical protein